MANSTMTMPGASGAERRLSLLPAYYLGTPLLGAIEILSGWTFRLHLPGDVPVIRYSYYAICFLAGVIIYARPRWRHAVGLAESSVNIVLLIFSVMIGYYAALDVAIAGGTGGEIQSGSVVNLILSATVFVMSYFRHRVAIATAGAGNASGG